MPLDSRKGLGVASFLTTLIAGCGPRVAVEPVGGTPDEAGSSAAGGGHAFGREVVLAEMCPQIAGGQAGLAPLVSRGVRWESDPGMMSALVERGAVARYLVLGYDGQRAGTFDASGEFDGELPQLAASGVYVGSAPCTRAVAGGGSARAEDPACNAAAKGCGLAIGEADTDRLMTLDARRLGGACMDGDDLAVDIDGDGRIERYPLAAFLDEVRAPAEMVRAQPAVVAACTPTFSIHGLTLAPGLAPETKVDDQVTLHLDVLGVIDVDADGRRELVLSIRYPGGRSVVVYGAVGEATDDDVTSIELARLGEAVGWP